MTGPVVAVVEHEKGAPLGRMADWLRRSGLELVTHRPYRGDRLPASGSFDALIVLGGRPGASDDDRAPWLPRLRALMADAVGEATPQLGICLGAQLLAVAAGGEVRRSERGPEIGVIQVRLAENASGDVLASALPDPYTTFSYHYDHVSALPPDAVQLGGSELAPHQLFRIGARAWGIQSHPEVSPEDFIAWLDNDPDGLSQAERKEVRSQVAAFDEVLSEHGRAVAQAFSAIVLDRSSGPLT